MCLASVFCISVRCVCLLGCILDGSCCSSFHGILVAKFGKSTVPTLTGKKLVKFSSSTIMHRREKLQQFLKDILSTPYLRESTELKLFLSVRPESTFGDGGNLSGDDED